MDHLRIGAKLPVFGPIVYEVHLADAARRAEVAGFDSVWVSDHVVMVQQSRTRYPYSADGAITWEEPGGATERASSPMWAGGPWLNRRCGGATPACQASGACGECSATNLTLCTGTTPACDTTAGVCEPRSGSKLLPGVIVFRNLNRSLSVVRTRVVFSAIMDL